MPSIYKTARGAMLDMDALRLNNETTVAVGNARVNARGDQLDEHGNILTTRNQAMNEHYQTDLAGRSNMPRSIKPAQSNTEAKARASAEADALDSAKLQETIARLTQQLAEKQAAENIVTPSRIDNVIIPDEIDMLAGAEFDAPNSETDIPGAAPLRGGLASAIQKQKEQQSNKNKRI